MRMTVNKDTTDIQGPEDHGDMDFKAVQETVSQRYSLM